MGEAILAKGNRPVDVKPTAGSLNLVTSGGVAEAIENVNVPPEVYVGNGTPTGEEVLWVNTNALNGTAVMRTISYAVVDSSIVYVSNSGNDETANGTTDAPYASLQAAVNSIPKDLNGSTITICALNDGEVFNEEVTLSGFYGGEIVLTSVNSGASLSISKLNVVNCTMVKLQNLTLLTAGLVETNSTVYVENSFVQLSGAITGIDLKIASNFITDEKSTIEVVDCVTAINATGLSRAYIYSITGGDTNMDDGIIADNGSAVSITNSSLVASTLFTTSSGGTISINAQPTVANY